MSHTKSHAVYVVQKGDNLWNIVKQVYRTTSNAVVARKLKEVTNANKQIRNPNVIHPGDLIYLPESAVGQSGPSAIELSEATRDFRQMNLDARTQIVRNWDTLNYLSNESLRPEGPAFVKDTGLSPRQLAGELGGTASPISDTIVPYTKAAWRTTKGIATTGALASTGQFGNLLQANPHTWQKVNGQLARSISKNVRYIRQSNGVARMIPKQSRAFKMAGDVILVQPGKLSSFSRTVKQTKQFYTGLHSSVNKANFGVKLGLATMNVADAWGTENQNRVIAREGTKLAVGGAVSRVLAGAGTHAICGALTLTTGAGGIACYLVVYIAADYASSKIIDAAVDNIYDSAVATPQAPIEPDVCRIP